ncbi:hypothetical protein AAKU67_002867 [Oxalobacteraceae bacterium GrIS 2.11]
MRIILICDRIYQIQTPPAHFPKERMNKLPLVKLIAVALAAMLINKPAMADEAALLKRIDQLSAEIEAIKAELLATHKKTDEVEQKQVALDAQIQTKNAEPPSAAVAAPASSGPATVVSSYGEIYYSKPKNNSSAAQTDVARAVIGLTHRFDEQTKMVAEFEWEHAVTSATDRGESEVEQLYVEHELSPYLSAKAGLFLMPVGLLNTAHEPTAFYGVYRNFVETAIIPSTWREAGLGLTAHSDSGFTVDAGITTGFDLSKWDATSTDGLESPLGSIHQEGQFAKSGSLAVHSAVNWRGYTGLLIGGSVFSGKAGQGTPGFAANDARVTIWDMHARYTPGKWDLTALYSRGSINNIDALNQTFVGQTTPVPSAFFGGYVQAAYKLWKSPEYSLAPFIRYERFNTASSYTQFAAKPDQDVTTVGANFMIGEGVVLKADYQNFKNDSSRDRLNLGLGYAF